MTDAEIDKLAAQVDGLISKVEAAVGKAKHTFTFSHDDHQDDGNGNGNDDADADYEDVSNPSMHADDDSNGVDDGDDNDEDGLDLEGDDDDYNTSLSKLGGPPRYQQERTASYIQSNDASNRPGSRQTSRHPAKGVTIAEATRPGQRHKFDDRVDFIKDRDSVTKQVALTRARQEYPADYEDYQKFNAGSSAQEQYARRAGYGIQVGKSAPTRFEQLVEAEMRKTQCSYEICAQRVGQAHGFRAFDTPSQITKRRSDLLYEFNKRTCEIMRDDHVDATEATRRARLEDYKLFSALQQSA
jgi:hypothetical protein